MDRPAMICRLNEHLPQQRPCSLAGREQRNEHRRRLAQLQGAATSDVVGEVVKNPAYERR